MGPLSNERLLPSISHINVIASRRSHWVKLAALAVLVAATPQPAAADVLYVTGFEPPTFTPGLLDGQDGWFAGLGLNAAAISTQLPFTGLQSVRIDGSLAEPIDGIFGAAYGRGLSYDPIASGTPLIRLAAEVNLTGAITPTTSFGVGLSSLMDGVAVANIQLGVREVGGNFVSYLSNADAVSASLLGYQPGQWVNVSAVFDFDNRTVEGFVNGQIIGTVPFTSGVDNTLPAAFMFMSCPAQPLTGTLGYIDDLVIETVPEPSILTLTGIGLLALLGFARGRENYNILKL
jgi:hypothetical protein